MRGRRGRRLVRTGSGSGWVRLGQVVFGSVRPPVGVVLGSVECFGVGSGSVEQCWVAGPLGRACALRHSMQHAVLTVISSFGIRDGDVSSVPSG